jgi:hypothetical protein
MEKRLILTSIYIVTIILFTIIISAVPAPQDIFEFKQPNNNTFSGKIMGDEWQHWTETIEGYSIVKNTQGYWTYALKDNEELIYSEYIVGIADPHELNLTKNLNPSYTTQSEISVFRPVETPKFESNGTFLNIPIYLSKA